MAVGAVGTPLKLGEAKSAPPAAETSLASKDTDPRRPLKADTPTAAMSAVVSVTAPVRPLKLATPAATAATAAITNAVVANWVVEVAGAAVGAEGTPVNA